MADKWPAALPADARPFFIPDDGTTFLHLIWMDKDVQEELEPLFQRLRQDPVDTTPWEDWLKQPQDKHGISIPSIPRLEVEKPHLPNKIPGSFDTAAGRSHLKAVQAVLNVDESTAVQITLNYMYGGGVIEANQDLYGSCALFEKVVDHAYKLQVVRIRVLGEALRSELDESTERYRKLLLRLLDELDEKCKTKNGEKRGIFQLLLLIACRTNTEMTRDQLLPTKELWFESPRRKPGDATKEFEWKSLGHRIIERQRRFVLEARKEALDALIVLFYNRLEVTRADLAMLLTALGAHDFFANDNESSKKLGYLAALACVTACKLCEVQSANHPLIREKDANAIAERLEICQMLKVVLYSKYNKPQGLAALAYGFMLHLGGQSDNEKRVGNELAQIAVNDGNADVYFEETMNAIIEKPCMEPEIMNLQWYEENGETLQTSEEDLSGTTEIKSSALLYASVGSELLVALIETFGNVLLDLQRSSYSENLNVMANLMKAVHCNSEGMCTNTWNEWTTYKNENGTKTAFCRVIEASCSLARKWLHHRSKPDALQFLKAVSPIWKIASSLVCDTESLENALNFLLDSSLISTSLAACNSSIDPENMQILRTDVLQSFCTLVGFAQTNKCRSAFRSLDANSARVVSSSYIGPQQLFQIAKTSGSIQILSTVTIIVAGLLPGAPPLWFLQTIFALEGIQQEARGSGNILGRQKASTEALVHLTHTLVIHMNTVLFDEGVEENARLHALNSISTSIFSIVDVLISSTSALSGALYEGKPLPQKIAVKIMATLGNAITMLRALALTHVSEKITTVAFETVDSLVQMASKKSSVGDSILYFATLPAALSVAFALQETAKDAALLSALHGTTSVHDFSNDLHSILRSRIHSIDEIPVDLDALEADGWLSTGSAKDIRDSSVTALRFLVLMFEHLDYMGKVGNDSNSLLDKNPYALILTPALPCLRVRRSSDLAKAWSSSGIRYIELLMRILQLDEKETSLGQPAFALLDSYIKYGSHDFQQALRTSAGFKNLIRVSFDKLVERKADLSNGIRDGKMVAACLGAFQKCLELGNAVVDPKQESAKWKTLVEYINTYSKGGTRKLEDVALCNESLLLLSTLRKVQLSRSDDDYFTVDQSFLSAVAKIIKQESDKGSLMSSASPMQFVTQVQLISTALEFLTLEIHQSGFEASGNDSMAIKALESALTDGSTRQFTAWAEKTLLVTEMPSFIEDFLSYREELKRLNLFGNEVLSDIINVFGSVTAFPTSDSLSLWLSSLRRTNCISSQLSLALYRLHVRYACLKRQMNQAIAARDLILLLSQDTRSRMTSTGFASSMFLTVSEVLRRNLLSVKSAASLPSVYALVDTMTDVADGSASLLVQLACQEEGPSGLELWRQNHLPGLLDELKESANHALDHSECQQKHCLLVQKLLIAATKLTEIASKQEFSTTEAHASSHTGDMLKVQVSLSRIACVVLKRLGEPCQGNLWGGSTERAEQLAKCFTTCVSFLCQSCEYSRSSVEQKYFLSSFCEILTETDATQALVSAVSDRKMRKRLGHEGVLSVFCLFQILATLENKQMLSSLFDKGVRQALLANYEFQTESQVIAGVMMRGYVSLRSRPSRVTNRQANVPVPMHIGQDDCQHEIQLSGTLFVAAALRSISINEFSGDSFSRNIRSAALDYLGSCGSILRACLQQVSNISFTPAFSTITIRSLREASSTLSLIAELCRSNNADEFMQRFPDLYKEYVDDAMTVARSLCLFLGASGYSRELFRVLGDEESGHQNAGGSKFGLSPLRDFLSRGFSNEKHDAIRFSHFVSRCSAAVTENEHQQQNQYPQAWAYAHRRSSVEDPLSESFFEQKSKGSVTNNLNFKLEKEASQCLFHALDIIWKTRRVNSSFVSFSEAELQSLPLSNFVGSTVAFRFGERTGEESMVYYGKVKFVDIVNRTWKVHMAGTGSGEELTIVPVHCTLGIQDESQRRPALEFSAAYENSIELEKSGPNLATGHLIAALRWCHEYSFGFGSKVSTSRLAQVLSIVLGIEISFARETRAVGHSTTVDFQLLDLYGNEEQLCTGLDSGDGTDAGAYFRREGRLRSLLPDSIWDAIRNQIASEIDRATQDVQNRREKKRSRSIEGEGLFRGSFRRSPSSRSPFRQISM